MVLLEKSKEEAADEGKYGSGMYGSANSTCGTCAEETVAGWLSINFAGNSLRNTRPNRLEKVPLRVHVAALKSGHDEEKGAESCWRWYFRLSLRARLLPF